MQIDFFFRCLKVDLEGLMTPKFYNLHARDYG